MNVFGLHVRRTTFALLLLGILFMGSAFAFAFWDQTEETIDNHEIVLGEAAVLRVDKTLSSDKILVPYGSFLGANEQDVYYFTFRAFFNKEGRLSVSIDQDSVVIGDGNHDFNHLVEIIVNTDDVFDEISLSNTLIVPFDEATTEDGLYYRDIYFRLIVTSPEAETDYQAAYEVLKGQQITFTIVFEALELE